MVNGRCCVTDLLVASPGHNITKSSSRFRDIDINTSRVTNTPIYLRYDPNSLFSNTRGQGSIKPHICNSCYHTNIRMHKTRLSQIPSPDQEIDCIILDVNSRGNSSSSSSSSSRGRCLPVAVTPDTAVNLPADRTGNIGYNNKATTKSDSYVSSCAGVKRKRASSSHPKERP